VPDVGCERERRGRADVRADAEEDFLHTNTDAAQEKEVYRCEKEISDANTVTDFITHYVTQKKESSVHRRRIASGNAEEEKDFTNSNPDVYTFAASKEENVAVARTIRNAHSNSKCNSVANVLAGLEKARRSQCDVVAEGDQGFRKLSAESAEAFDGGA
jgi:hypothetical protein